MYSAFDHWAYLSQMLTVISMFLPCTRWVFGPLSPVSEPPSVVTERERFSFGTFVQEISAAHLNWPDPRRPPITPIRVSCHGCGFPFAVPPLSPDPRRLPQLQPPPLFLPAVIFDPRLTATVAAPVFPPIFVLAVRSRPQ